MGELLRITVEREVLEPDPCTESKRRDMEACMEKFYSSKKWHWNVISIGDASSEQRALKQVLHQPSVAPAVEECPNSKMPLCKTVNLLDHPTLEQLSSELRVLMVWLGHIVEYDQDFDLPMDGLDGLEKTLFNTKR